MENVRKHRNIKLIATEKRRNYLVSEPNYHTIKFFTKIVLTLKMKKIFLVLSISELSKKINV